MKSSTHTKSSSEKRIPELVMQRIRSLTEAGDEKELFAILDRQNIQSLVPTLIEESLLPTAIQHSRINLVKKFLDRLIDHPSLFSFFYFSYIKIYWAAIKEKKLEVAGLIIQYMADKAQKQGICLLPQIRDLETIQAMFQYHPDKAKSFLEQVDNKGNSAFELIIIEGLQTELANTNIIRELLTHGADINLPNKTHGGTPLLGAITNISVSDKSVRKLIQLGADPNQSSKSNKLTPLTKALESFRPSIVRLLLTMGATYTNLTTTHKAYPTPLFYHLTLIKQIVYDMTEIPLSAELVINIYEIVNILVDYETIETLSVVNDKNQTVLELALDMCMDNLISKLIVKGANISSEKIITLVTELLLNFKKRSEMGSSSQNYYQDFFKTIVVLLKNEFPIVSLDTITRDYLFKKFLPHVALAELYVKAVNQEPLSENGEMLKTQIEAAFNNDLSLLLPYIEKLNNDNLGSLSCKKAMLQILKHLIENPVSKDTKSKTKKKANEDKNPTLSIILDSCTALEQEISFELMIALIQKFGVKKVSTTLLSAKYKSNSFYIELFKKALESNKIAQQDFNNSHALNLAMQIHVEKIPQKTRGEFLKIAKILTEKFFLQDSDETRQVETLIESYHDDKKDGLTKDKKLALHKEFYPIFQTCEKSKSKFISVATLIFNSDNSYLFNELIYCLSKGPFRDELKTLTQIALSLLQIRKSTQSDVTFICGCLNKIANLKVNFSIYLPSDDINKIAYLMEMLKFAQTIEMILFILRLAPTFNSRISRDTTRNAIYTECLSKVFQQFDKTIDLNAVSMLSPELLRIFGRVYLSHYIIELSESFIERARPFAYYLLMHGKINANNATNQEIINKLASLLDNTQLIEVLLQYQDMSIVFQRILERIVQNNKSTPDVVIQRLYKSPIILRKYAQTLNKKQNISLSTTSIDILIFHESIDFSDEESLFILADKGHLLKSSSFTALAEKNYDNNQRYRLYIQYHTENSERLAILERSLNLKVLLRMAINNDNLILAVSLYKKIDLTLKVSSFYEMLLNQVNTDKLIPFISMLEESEIDLLSSHISKLSKEKASNFSIRILDSNSQHLFLKCYKNITNYAQLNTATKNKLLDFFARNNLEAPFFSVLATIDDLPENDSIDQFLSTLKSPSLPQNRKNSLFSKIVSNKNSFDRLISANKDLTVALVREKFPDESEDKEYLLSLLIRESDDLEISNLFEKANDKDAFLQCCRKFAENFNEAKKYHLYSKILKLNIPLNQEESAFLKENALSRKDFAILLLAFPNEITRDYVAKNDPNYNILATLIIHNYATEHNYKLKIPNNTLDLLFDRIIELRKVVSPELMKLIVVNYSHRLHTIYDVMQASCPYKYFHSLSQQFLRRSKQFLNEFDTDFSLPIQESSDKKLDRGLYNFSLINYISYWNKLMVFMGINNPKNLKYIEQLLLSIDAHPGMLTPIRSFPKNAAIIINCLQKQQAKYESPIYYGGSTVDVLLHKSLASNFDKKNEQLYEIFLSQSDLDITIEIGECQNDAAFEFRLNEIINTIHQECGLLPDTFPIWSRDKTTGKRYCNIKYLNGFIDISVNENITQPVTTLTTKIDCSRKNSGKIIYSPTPKGRKHPVYQLVENTFSLNPEFNLSLLSNDSRNDAKKSLWHFVLKTIIRAQAFDIELDNEDLTMLKDSIDNKDNSVFFYLVIGWYVDNIFLKNIFGSDYQQELLNGAAKIKLSDNKTIADLINNILTTIATNSVHAMPVYEQVAAVKPVAAYNPTNLVMYGNHTAASVNVPAITPTQEVIQTFEEEASPPAYETIIPPPAGNFF